MAREPLSVVVTASMAAPNVSCSASIVRAAADLSRRLTLDQIISMGLKSGE